jgi:fructose-1,6-bisphosphatase/inositol monophosphatase family enzyme
VLADVVASEIAIGAELSPPQTTKLAGRQHVASAPNDEAHAADALVSFGLPYAMSARQVALAIIRAAVPHVRGVRIAGSAACDFLAWAHGECDAFVGCGLAEWDTAAGQAIVLAAGGAVRSVGTPDFEILVAASRPLAGELCGIVDPPPH